MPEPLPAPQASLNFAENVSSEPLRRSKRRRFAIILGLLCALLGGGFAALREPPASKMFMEGCYSGWAPGTMGDDSYQADFRAGRFEHLTLSRYYDRTSFGTYEVRNSTVTLRYDREPDMDADEVIPAQILHYRNVGGVAVLISEPALSTYEKTGKLAVPEPEKFVDGVIYPGTPNFYVRRQRLGNPSGNAWALLGFEYPDFLAALPEEMRKANTISRKTYLRYRWEDFLSEHPELSRRLPNWMR